MGTPNDDNAACSPCDVARSPSLRDLALYSLSSLGADQVDLLATAREFDEEYDDAAVQRGIDDGKAIAPRASTLEYKIVRPVRA